ncbi:MAG: helix-turn-helix domain-containing protein [Candidatus Bathyarchaeia archaeon]|nr:helix-turn-helix domain-containing protein [Candidatus Bathyarchaeota archaeon]
MKNLWNEPYYVTIEVENKKCKILRLMQAVGIQQFKVTDIRGLSGGLIRHLVELPPTEIKHIPKDKIVKITIKSKSSTVWVESEGCDVCNAILSHGSFLASGRTIQNSTILYSFVAPSFEAYKSIISALESNNFRVKILKLGRFEVKGKALTENQERILWLALKTGFFDYPKKINIVKLSRKLGISPSTLSEVIRRGVRRVLENYFGH